MRATHIRPRTAPTSSDRPGTAHSTRSTIRQVEPSPDSLSNALVNGYAAEGGTPTCEPSFEHFQPFKPGKSDEEYPTSARIPSTDPKAIAPALKRGGTPSGRSSPRKSRSCSPQKSRSESPRKRMIPTPRLHAHQESPSSSYLGAEEEIVEPPDTPSPVTREQQMQAYAPLQVRKPFAVQNGNNGDRIEGHGTHVRIADYMREMKNQRMGRSSLLKKDQKNSQNPAAPNFDVPKQPTSKDPARQVSISRRSEASGASLASKHSIFSTPGRDEMERKKTIVEEDEGPFAKAMSMQDLEQTRKRVCQAEKKSGRGRTKRMVCGMTCVVM